MKKFLMFLLVVATVAILTNACDETEFEEPQIEKEEVIIPATDISSVLIKKDSVVIPSNG